MALQRKLLNGCAGIPKFRWLSNEGLRHFSGQVAAPTELPRFDYQPKPYKGPLADEVLEKRKKFLGPSLFHYYQKPVKILFFLFLYGVQTCVCNALFIVHFPGS